VKADPGARARQESERASRPAAERAGDEGRGISAARCFSCHGAEALAPEAGSGRAQIPHRNSGSREGKEQRSPIRSRTPPRNTGIGPEPADFALSVIWDGARWAQSHLGEDVVLGRRSGGEGADPGPLGRRTPRCAGALPPGGKAARPGARSPRPGASSRSTDIYSRKGDRRFPLHGGFCEGEGFLRGGGSRSPGGSRRRRRARLGRPRSAEALAAGGTPGGVVHRDLQAGERCCSREGDIKGGRTSGSGPPSETPP